MLLYIVRHGETDWNTKKLFQGRTDIPLNEKGRRVAHLTKEGLKDTKFDVAFCSPLKRAKETALILMEGRDVEVIEENRLIEMSFGCYEGTPMVGNNENVDNFFKRPELYQAPEDGETIEEIFERGRDFLNELYANPDYQDSTILIATHGAMLNGLLCVIEDAPVTEYGQGILKNCSITKVEVTDGTPKILEKGIILYEESMI